MSRRAVPEDRPVRPPRGGRRWTSFVADDAGPGKVVRGLHEATNPSHRLRVEHDQYTLLIHLSDEDSQGWTTIAVDRATRQSAIAQGLRQSDTAHSAYQSLYQPDASALPGGGEPGHDALGDSARVSGPAG